MTSATSDQAPPTTPAGAIAQPPPPWLPLPPPPVDGGVAMSGAATICTMIGVVCETTVPLAVTVSVSVMPGASDGSALIVSVDVPAADMTDAGANDAVRFATVLADSATVSETPVVLASVRFTVAMPPAG